MLKKLARDKHSSLLRISVNYGRKKFYKTGPRVSVIKAISKLNIGMFVTGRLFIPSLIFASKAWVGNCDIHTEPKILVMNKTKWYKIW
jgi:hypothetical protein